MQEIMDFDSKPFLSTPSARRATADAAIQSLGFQDFYPRPPRGGRPRRSSAPTPPQRFLSTPSARRATRDALATAMIEDISIHALREEGDARAPSAAKQIRISIHALREEGDAASSFCWILISYFYPRPPRGGRPPLWLHPRRSKKISIHALREEGDLSCYTCAKSERNFYPRPPRGGRHQFYIENMAEDVFLSTPSARRATPRILPRSQTVKYFYPRPPRGGRPHSSLKS